MFLEYVAFKVFFYIVQVKSKYDELKRKPIKGLSLFVYKKF